MVASIPRASVAPVSLLAPFRRRPVALAAGAFLLVSAAHLVAHLAGAERFAEVSQWFVMPLLALVVWTATTPVPDGSVGGVPGGSAGGEQDVSAGGPARRLEAGSQSGPVGASAAGAPVGAGRSRLARWTLVALGFSWLGDSAPDLSSGDASFLTMVGFFLVAQVAYLIVFWPYRGRSLLRRPLALVPYGLALGALIAVCAPYAGSLLVPVVVYGVCLVSMGVLSTGVDRVAGIGGAIFLVSDALIALGAFVPGFTVPGPLSSGFWVMLTYLAGQALLVVGILRRDARAMPDA
ncbi:lysoplasmalogenase [Oerskovia turbata]